MFGGIIRTLSRVVSLKSKDVQAAAEEPAPGSPLPHSAHLRPMSKYESSSMVSRGRMNAALAAIFYIDVGFCNLGLRATTSPNLHVQILIIVCQHLR